jgi:hypothetical protein
MNLSRRRALSGVSLLALMVAVEGCGASAATTPAQIIADASGLVSVLQTDLPLIAAIDPALMTPAQQATAVSDLASAQTLVATVTPSVAATESASTLQQVETAINVGLDALSAVATATATSPLAPYALPIQAAIVLAGGLEAWINATLGTNSTVATARVKAVPGMAAAQARQVLGIKSVS